MDTKQRKPPIPNTARPMIHQLQLQTIKRPRVFLEL